jgi:arylsulfatase A-like enzyme
MRGRIRPLFVALVTLVLTVDLGKPIAAEPARPVSPEPVRPFAAEPVRPRAAEAGKPHNILVFVADGLRPGMINEQTAPAMAALLKRGVNFTNTHAVFPTVTTPNAASVATGHMPGDTGDFGNTIYAGFAVAVANGNPTPFLESDPVLAELDTHFTGNYLNEETILRAAAAANFSTAAIGKLGPVLILDHTDRTAQQTVTVDDMTGHPGGIPLVPEMQTALQEFGLSNAAPSRGDNAVPGDAGHAGTVVANIEQQRWFTDVATLAVLPIFKERRKPFLMVFWSRDPDGTQHNQGDSLMRLVPGINGPTSLAAIRNADSDLARLLAALDEQGLSTTTDIVLTSDHGFSTISKESATSFAATKSYPNVPAGMLPPGFVAIDLAHGLRMSLFDPDAAGDAKTTVLPSGSAPLHGNGLIGDEAAQPEVVVAANGGSDLIYLPKPDKLTAARIVQILAAQDYASGIFVDSRLGPIGGTLPLSAVALEGGALTPTPAIVVNFRSFSTGCTDPTTCGVEVADTVLQQGQGIHGSFSRADTRNVMAAAGPGFRTGYEDPAPASNADLGKTIAAMLGLRMKDKGKLTGRVLTEALVNGAPVVAKTGVLKSAPDDAGSTTDLKYQTIGITRYFDAAGYRGRTLGLD